MTSIGYTLSSEEHGPTDLVRYAKLAEDAGFDFAAISDHYHPWVDAQGHSPFVWSVLGGCAVATERLRYGTEVTCPIIRIHPAIVAQAAATTAAMMPGRFFLGVGSGENLNEHITGARWPAAKVRLDMLEEAIDVIRELWKGENTSHYGKHYTVENGRIYTTPPSPPPIYVAAKGERATVIAGEKRRPHRRRARQRADSSIRTRGRRRQAEIRSGTRLLGPRRERSPAHRASAMAERGDRGRAGGRATAAAPLRAGGEERYPRRCRRAGRVRPRSRASPLSGPGVHRCGIRSRLRSPDRAASGRVHSLLQRRRSAEAVS